MKDIVSLILSVEIFLLSVRIKMLSILQVR